MGVGHNGRCLTVRSRVPSLVGRKEDSQTLAHHLAIARQGRTQVVLLAGDPGIGKTRLMKYLVAQVGSEGVIAQQGGASDAEGMPPYLPFLEALDQYIRRAAPDQLRNQTGPMASVLATILPELTLRLEDLPASYPLPPEQARLRLYEAVGLFLAAIAAEQPLLLTLDDLHWADPASLDLLCYVARHQPSIRLLILGAYRAGEAELRPAFDRAIAELHRLRVLTTITLGPLPAADLTALAETALGGPVDARVGTLLAAHSEGNPFFAEELLRGWQESGALVQVERGWRLAGSMAPTLPPSIVSAVRQRVNRLTLEVVELLRTAAIMGRTFHLELLAEVAGQEAEAVEEHLQEAVRAQLVRADQAENFTFTHDKIRECLYQEVTLVRRRRLHGFIGRALEIEREVGTSRPGTEAQRLAELAFHFGQSGDRERGAAYAQQAADQALRTYAFEEATAQYRMALDLIDAADRESDPRLAGRRGELLLGLGEAAMLAGAELEAVTAFQAAQTWFEETAVPERAGHAGHRLGQAWWRQERILEARSALEGALALLEEHPGPELVGVLVDLAGLLGINLNQLPQGIAHGRRALQLAEQLEDESLRAVAGRGLGNLLVRANDLPAGIPLLEQALAYARAADDPAEATECCAYLGFAYAWQGAMLRAYDTGLQSLIFAQRCHDPYQLRHVYTALALLQAYRGELVEAKRLLDQEQAIVERLASPEPLAFLTLCRGILAFIQGQYDTAEALMQEVLAVIRETSPDSLVWYMGLLCMVQAALGKGAEARACVEELEARLAAVPEGTLPTAEALAHLTATAVALGARERLARYYPKLLAFEGQFHDLLIDRLLGQIETVQGNWAAAQAHLTAAETVARQEGILWELANTLEAAADLALVQGGAESRERTQELLGEALELSRRFGDAPRERHLRDRLRILQGSRPRRSQLPAGLSPREAEVLRLVASGKTNRQIATELVLSEKTVINHLTSIYTKIGVDNRAAAVAFAVRHDLA